MQPNPQPNPNADSNRSRGDDGQPVHDDRTITPPAHTPRTDTESAENDRHPDSENALPSTQDKNPIPPDSTRSSEN